MKFVFFLFFTAIIVFADNAVSPADLHYHSGLEYYHSGDAGKAKIEFQKALEAEKQHTDSIKMLQVLENEIFKEAPSDPFNGIIKEYFEKGIDSFRKNDKAKAFQEWEKALAISPANKQLQDFCKLVKPLERKQGKEENNKKKIEVYSGEKIVEKNKSPGDKNSEKKSSNSKNKVDEKKVFDLYYEGLKYYKLGDLKKAISLWEQVLLLDPNMYKAGKNLENAKRQLALGEKK